MRKGEPSLVPKLLARPHTRLCRHARSRPLCACVVVLGCREVSGLPVHLPGETVRPVRSIKDGVVAGRLLSIVELHDGRTDVHLRGASRVLNETSQQDLELTFWSDWVAGSPREDAHGAVMLPKCGHVHLPLLLPANTVVLVRLRGEGGQTSDWGELPGGALLVVREGYCVFTSEQDSTLSLRCEGKGMAAFLVVTLDEPQTHAGSQVRIRAPLAVVNMLPLPLSVGLCDPDNPGQPRASENSIESGGTIEFLSAAASLDGALCSFRIDETTWSQPLAVRDHGLGDDRVLELDDANGRCLRLVICRRPWGLRVRAPYWILNHTALPLIFHTAGDGTPDAWDPLPAQVAPIDEVLVETETKSPSGAFAGGGSSAKWTRPDGSMVSSQADGWALPSNTWHWEGDWSLDTGTGAIESEGWMCVSSPAGCLHRRGPVDRPSSDPVPRRCAPLSLMSKVPDLRWLELTCCSRQHHTQAAASQTPHPGHRRRHRRRRRQPAEVRHFWRIGRRRSSRRSSERELRLLSSVHSFLGCHGRPPRNIQRRVPELSVGLGRPSLRPKAALLRG